MKKIIIGIFTIIFGLPTLASCPITGFCAPTDSTFAPLGLQEKYTPNNLSKIQKPDAFLPQYKQPYHNLLLNTEAAQQDTSSGINNESSYNSNCQFGLCIPGTGMSEPEP